ncbi:MAG TPA: hypothetical protein VGT79_05940 [Xanthomonadaceae bacterium]|nr:hypothetical protein [Xanthomonadaceae bacterium]
MDRLMGHQLRRVLTPVTEQHDAGRSIMNQIDENSSADFVEPLCVVDAKGVMLRERDAER